MKKLLFPLLIFPLVFCKAQTGFPKLTGHFGILHPLLTFSDGSTSFNFNNSYTVGFPVGINFWKTDKIGFSLEIVPLIKNENGTHKVSNIMIHPGILYRFSPTFTFAGRAAFETNGRYGVTPIFNKVLKKNKLSNYYLAIPFPVRAGNDKPISVTFGAQVGISF